MKKLANYEISSGNIFKDLGLPDAEELDTKARLALEISRIVSRRGMTQLKAARILRIDQPKVSALVRGHLEKFSVGRLCELLTRLGCDVSIRVHEKRRSSPGKLTVKAA